MAKAEKGQTAENLAALEERRRLEQGFERAKRERERAQLGGLFGDVMCVCILDFAYEQLVADAYYFDVYCHGWFL